MKSLNTLKIPSLLLLSLCLANTTLAQQGFLPGLLHRKKKAPVETPQAQVETPQAKVAPSTRLLIDLDSQEMESVLSKEGDVQSALNAYKKLRSSEKTDEKQIIEALHGMISIWEVSNEDFQAGVQPYADLLAEILENSPEISEKHSFNLIWAAYECVYPVAQSNWSSYLALRGALSEALRTPGLDIADYLQSVKSEMTPLSNDTLAFQNTSILNRAKNFHVNELDEGNPSAALTPASPLKNVLQAYPIERPIENPVANAEIQMMPTPSALSNFSQEVPDTDKIRELKEKLEQSQIAAKAQGKIPNVDELIAYSTAVKEEIDAREAAQKALQNSQAQAEDEIQKKRSNEAAELRSMKQSDAEAALEARRAELEAQRIELEKRLQEINKSLGR